MVMEPIRGGRLANLSSEAVQMLPAFAVSEFIYQGHCGEDAYLTFYDLRICAEDVLELPADHTYRVELIDNLEMTRTLLLEQVSGKTQIQLPAKEGMAVLTTRICG